MEVVRSAEPQHVFADGQRAVESRFRNADAEPACIEVRLQLLQLTSATATLLGGARAWKTLSVQPGQTVVESATVEFPPVRVATYFAVRWLDAGGKVLGVTEVWAHPERLLDTLKLMAGDQPIGVFDETGVLRPALAAHGIAVRELSSADGWSDFRGRLALVVSQSDANQGELRLAAAALARVKEGLAVVWFRPPPKTSQPTPSLAERVGLGGGAVVLAPAATLVGLDRSAAAQLALVRLAELALLPPTQLLASDP